MKLVTHNKVKQKLRHDKTKQRITNKLMPEVTL